MKIQQFTLHLYQITLINNQIREGAWLKIRTTNGQKSLGDVAPLPKWSKETLQESLGQLLAKYDEILSIDWTYDTCLDTLQELDLLPSASFGLESALLDLLHPIGKHQIPVSTLFMGTPEEILQQAQLRYAEGYTSAKLKVGNLSFEEAFLTISHLKNRFRLRIDVNRAWSTSDSLAFFKQFPLDLFDYVEEPFQNPDDLQYFTHPLGIDESFKKPFQLEQLKSLPTLKAIIYKPTVQGGILGSTQMHQWAIANHVDLILSSSFESTIGLMHIASMAHRLALPHPIGIGTYHHIKTQQPLC